jgi:hypothetical protein
LAGVDGTPDLIRRLAGTIGPQQSLLQGAPSGMRCGGEQVSMIPINHCAAFSTAVKHRR